MGEKTCSNECQLRAKGKSELELKMKGWMKQRRRSSMSCRLGMVETWELEERREKLVAVLCNGTVSTSVLIPSKV